MLSDTLLIAVSPGELRGAVLVRGQVWQVDHFRDATPDLTGAIYRGRVRRLDPGMNAAFVELGGGWSRDGLLRARDAGPKDAPPRIQQLVQEGATVIVQISGGNAVQSRRPADAATDLDDAKGPSVTTRIGLPGRYLRYQVNRRGVAFEARPEPDLVDLWCGAVEELCQTGEGATLTAQLAEAASAAKQSRDDMQFRQLLGDVAEELSEARRTWHGLKDKSAGLDGPGLIMAPANAVEQFLDVHAHGQLTAIVVDDRPAAELARRWCRRRLPALVGKIETVAAGRSSFEAFEVDGELEAALASVGQVAGGGRLVIEPGTTLTAIDVNSGGADGRSGRGGLDVNLAAVPEIARQIRLRALSGPIVIDFVKMDPPDAAARPGGRERGRRGSRGAPARGAGDRDKVESALREAMAGDPARLHIAGWSPLGHLEVTRQHLAPSLAARLQAPAGDRMPAVDAVAYDLLRRIVKSGPVGAPVLRAAPALATLLTETAASALAEAGRRIGQDIEVVADPAIPLAEPQWPA